MRYDNLRIARLVASPERFAEAARNGRTAYGPAVRSVSVPERIDALFREMRAAEAEGRLTDDLRKTYWAAVADLEKVPTPALTEAVREPQREAPPQALEITAKREEPGAESAMLIYERGLDEPLMRRMPETKPARTPKPKQQKPPAPQQSGAALVVAMVAGVPLPGRPGERPRHPGSRLPRRFLRARRALDRRALPAVPRQSFPDRQIPKMIQTLLKNATT